MKAAWRWLLATVVCLTVGQGLAPAKPAKPPRAAALIAFPSHEGFPSWAEPDEPPDSLTIVGGYAPGRGWLASEQAEGLLRKGDRLPVYTLAAGPIATVRLTDNGSIMSRGFTSPYPYGLVYDAVVQFAPGTTVAQRRDPVTCPWYASGAHAPRRVWAREADRKAQVYRKTAARWLRRRGIKDSVIQRMRVSQVVRADVNHDGRVDTLLAFDWDDDTTPEWDPGAYLLLAYRPKGSERERIVELGNLPLGWFDVTGLYDLDHNGWAEIVVAHFNGEQWGTRLYYHTRRGFAFLKGDLHSY
jgi:hypothetical protein